MTMKNKLKSLIKKYFEKPKDLSLPLPYDEVYAKGFLSENGVVKDWTKVYYISTGKIYDPISKRIYKSSHIIQLKDFNRASNPDILCGTLYDFGSLK